MNVTDGTEPSFVLEDGSSSSDDGALAAQLSDDTALAQLAAQLTLDQPPLMLLDTDPLLHLLRWLSHSARAAFARSCRHVHSVVSPVLTSTKEGKAAELLRALNLDLSGTDFRLNRLARGGVFKCSDMVLLAPHLPASLEALSLRDSAEFGDAGLESLLYDARLARLRHLDLSGCSAVGTRGWRELASAARRGALPVLRMLNVSHTRLDDEGAAELAAALTCLPCLVQLNASDNLIGDQGATRLAGAAARMPGMRFLRLHNNTFSPACANLVNERLRRTGSLDLLGRIGHT
jgi:hypothetical protein